VGILFGVILVLALVGLLVYLNVAEPASKEDGLKAMHGDVNFQMTCPHCNYKGKIHTRRFAQKKGISGGKATAALFTGGVSMLATGLSRKELATHAYCDNCKNTWVF
jgi:hypothetical protein